MEIKKYFSQLRELHNLILIFIDDPDFSDQNLLINIIDFIKKEEIPKNREKIKHFLQILLQISNNHHRMPFFIDKIEQILNFLKEDIKRSLTSYEIFKIFESNKFILLFLFKENVIQINDFIDEIIEKRNQNEDSYLNFFISEIRNNVSKKRLKKLSNEFDLTIPEFYEEKRRNGVNDSYICTLIQKDSVEEFVSYVNTQNISLKSTISPSIYETNQLLDENEVTLIEYTTFYGSIQIFQYLKYNNVELTPSLWLYGIHSNNPEIIHILEENKVQFPENTYITILRESIKCHHNDIVQYIEDIYSDKQIVNYINEFSCQYYDYSVFQYDFESLIDSLFFRFLIGNCSFLIDDYIKEKMINNHEIDIKIAIDNKDLFRIYCYLMSYKNISNKLFYNCNNLQKVVIPSSISSIGDSAFENCSSLKEIVFGPFLQSIGSNSFTGCSSLSEIEIPSNVTFIGSGAFSKCESLKRIFIPFGIKSIESHTFCECKSLSYISLPSSLKTIKNNAFEHCVSLTNITIHSPVSICNYAFSNCLSLKQISNDINLTSIGNNSFDNCQSLTQITIPCQVKRIGDYSFNNCTSLTQVSISFSVTKIGDYSFNDCTSLTQISIPSSVTEIGKYSFNNCMALKQISIPSTVTDIGEGAFKECTSLKEISFPLSLKYIRNCTCYRCTSLKQISIPSSVKSIDHRSFSGCSQLSQIKLPSSITYIGYDVFENCTSLNEVWILSSDIEFEDYVFKGCTSLKKILYPKSLNLNMDTLGISYPLSSSIQKIHLETNE